MLVSPTPTLYAVRMKDTPLRHQSVFPMRTIVAHGSSLSTKEKERLFAAEACFFDDEGASSISVLNPWWGELTAVHWLVNNCEDEWMGNCQYRRSWNEAELFTLQAGKLYLSTPCNFGCSLAQQFMGGHQFPGVEMTMALANKGKLPFTAEEMAEVWNSSLFQGGPMAVGENNNYKKLMNVLFDCLWPIWEAYGNDIQQIKGYDGRAIAFLSERLLSGIIQKRHKFLGNIGVKHILQIFQGP